MCKWQILLKKNRDIYLCKKKQTQQKKNFLIKNRICVYLIVMNGTKWWIFFCLPDIFFEYMNISSKMKHNHLN